MVGDPRFHAFVQAIARGATQEEAAASLRITRQTAWRWAHSAGFHELVEEAGADEETAGGRVRLLRRRAFELAMGGNVRLLVWLLEHRGEIGGAAGGDAGRDGAGAAGVSEVEIVGLGPEGADDEQDGDDSGGGAFIEFIDDDEDERP